MNIKILVATHKAYWMPEDDVYLPLHVGKEGKQDLGFIGDNTGDNISNKNPHYCELTGLYWAWKNLRCNYIGLCHYRRYFSHCSFRNNCNTKKMNIFQRNDYEKLLKQYDVILPKKRNYYIETVRSHYEHAHYKKDMDEVQHIIEELYPEYLPSFKNVMDSTSLYILNMFVMNKELFDDYCKWLFSILFSLEQRIDIVNYNVYQARVYGFIAERLFNVWILNQNLNIVEVKVTNLEPENWARKISNFLKRKLFRSI